MPLCPQSHTISVEGGYCPLCARCTSCNLQMNATEYEFCLVHEIPFKHPACFDQVEKDQLSNPKIELPQAIFDKLNAARLLLTPRPEVSTATNQNESFLFAQQWLVDFSFEQQCLFLKRLESLAAACIQVIGRSHKEIDLEIAARDKKHFKESKEAQERQAQRLAETGSILETPHTTAKYEKRQLTKEEKMVETLMKAGLSESEAKSSVADAIARKKILQETSK